ncbi:hypothetical protein [Shewanella surugensis]|uniref:Uncharacterized protein n=1 Tax=Shewanella surugensis TaxID=212020 RepID=A0ABT0LJF0_9GAMM|nr:hypothetical protein [Shewanella surugensis]MCL1127495.1 hypothetical protein [Shewanella surugensis]
MSTEDDGVMTGEHLKQIVENQLSDGNPIKVKATLMRLMMTGTPRDEAIEAIACALSVEVLDVMQEQTAFNLVRYESHLDLLPDMSWMEE